MCNLNSDRSICEGLYYALGIHCLTNYHKMSPGHEQNSLGQIIASISFSFNMVYVQLTITTIFIFPKDSLVPKCPNAGWSIFKCCFNQLFDKHMYRNKHLFFLETKISELSKKKLTPILSFRTFSQKKLELMPIYLLSLFLICKLGNDSHSF